MFTVHVSLRPNLYDNAKREEIICSLVALQFRLKQSSETYTMVDCICRNICVQFAITMVIILCEPFVQFMHSVSPYLLIDLGKMFYISCRPLQREGKEERHRIWLG